MSNNGSAIRGWDQLPFELLRKIFCAADYETLSNCQLVCTRWRATIEEYIWREKTGLALNRHFTYDRKIPWQMFYFACLKDLFGKNLLKNPSGEEGNGAYWLIDGPSNHLEIEYPPIHVPELPNNPLFKGRPCCFTTFSNCLRKKQYVHLTAEGFHPGILDVLQPPIMIDEWYCCELSFPVRYKCDVKLLGDPSRMKKKSNIQGTTNKLKTLKSFSYNDDITPEKQNEWIHVSYVFEEYGKGLEKIEFSHEVNLIPIHN